VLTATHIKVAKDQSRNPKEGAVSYQREIPNRIDLKLSSGQSISVRLDNHLSGDLTHFYAAIFTDVLLPALRRSKHVDPKLPLREVLKEMNRISRSGKTSLKYLMASMIADEALSMAQQIWASGKKWPFGKAKISRSLIEKAGRASVSAKNAGIRRPQRS
jgi:hypothetical protein